eukprot:scaffold195092_cov41-Prasinocladus_malaysianus.AAC.1
MARSIPRTLATYSFISVCPAASGDIPRRAVPEAVVVGAVAVSPACISLSSCRLVAERLRQPVFYQINSY